MDRTASTTSDAFTSIDITNDTGIPVRYIRLRFTDAGAGNPNLELDGVSYSFFRCLTDSDLDGVEDRVDIDDDNDGIPDSSEFCNNGLNDFSCLPGGVDPSKDEDGDLVLNYLDANDTAVNSGCTDGNADGICDNVLAVYDTDGDGVPNHLDLDSDSDGITDAVEANGGDLPANMSSDGKFTTAYVQANDSDNDGLGNLVDADDIGTPLTNPDTDADNASDFLDIDADGDGTNDWIEGFDDDGDGNATNDYSTRGANHESTAGLGIYTTTDDDGDGILNWQEDQDGDGTPNFLDPDIPAFYRDTDGDGLVDLFDFSNSGVASTTPDIDSDGEEDYLDSDNQTALPIELVRFSARYRNGVVIVEWETATELNNDFFTIERSLNATDFEVLTTLPGAGNSQERISYQWSDLKPISGNSYYRLKQTDFDGQFTYSDIELVTFSSNGAFEVKVFPNPASELLSVTFDGGLNLNEVKIRLVDVSGKQVFSKIFTENQEIAINVSNLNRGIYLIEVLSGKFAYKSRVLISK